MYKLIKIFTIFFGVLAILGFVWVLSDGQGVLLALEQTSVFFGVHIALIGFFISSKTCFQSTYERYLCLYSKFGGTFYSQALRIFDYV